MSQSKDRQNFGLVREATGHAVLKGIPVPTLRDDYILVRTVAVALNPTDWTSLDAVGDPGTLVGCDYAGVVEEVGKDMTHKFSKGDRVAGFGHGANDQNPQTGAFAKFVAVKGALQMHIPDGVSFEAACTIGVGIGTVGYGLYKVLDLPIPSVTPKENGDNIILIYGGSTATATIAIQFARLSGWTVVTTCSPKHFDLMKTLGASMVYDYRTPNVGKIIREATSGRIKHVFDTVSTAETAAICADAVGPEGGVYCNLLGADCPREDVKSIFFLAYSLSGEDYIYEGEKFEAQPEDLAVGVKFMEMAEKLWVDHKWRPHPQRLESNGLSGIVDGMQQMRQGKVSGEKLVYRVAETQWP